MPRANLSTSKSSTSAQAIRAESHDAYAVAHYTAHAGVHELPGHSSRDANQDFLEVHKIAETDASPIKVLYAQGTRLEFPPGGSSSATVAYW